MRTRVLAAIVVASRWRRPGSAWHNRRRGAAGAVGVEAAERRRARHDSDGCARQQHVVWMACRAADRRLPGADVLRGARQSRRDCPSPASRRRARKSPASKFLSRSISVCRQTSEPRSSIVCARSASRSWRIASTASAPMSAARRRVFEFAKSINVPLIITTRRHGESCRSRQAGRRIWSQRRAREQGRSEDRDGPARGARQAAWA